MYFKCSLVSLVINIFTLCSRILLPGYATCAAQSYENEKDLLTYLFDPLRYTKSIRPVYNISKAIQVNVSQNIRLIESIDVTRGEICTLSYLSLSWFDNLLRWNASDFGGLSVINLPEQSFWLPISENLQTCGNAETAPAFVSAKVTNNGLVDLFMMKYIATYCLINMTIFPFDEHSCFYNFFNPKYSTSELTFQTKLVVLIDQDYLENQEWAVLNSGSYNYTFDFRATDISIVINYLTIARRPEFILVNTFAPMWLLSTLNFFVPLIPPDSGERLSFAVTVCLATMFVSMTVVTSMPSNSVSISVLSWNLLATDIMIFIGIIWSIFIINLSKVSIKERPIPSFLRRVLRSRTKRSRNFNSNGEYKITENIEVIKNGEGIKNVEGITTSRDKNFDTVKRVPENENSFKKGELFLEEHTKDIGWYEVSRLLDKMYFITTIICLILLTGVGIARVNSYK